VDCCTNKLSKKICSGNDGCDGGNSNLALDYVSISGIANESVYPYKAIDGTCKNSTTGRNKVVNAKTPVTFVTPVNNTAALQSALNTGPVIVYVDATKWDDYASGIFSDCPKHI